MGGPFAVSEGVGKGGPLAAGCSPPRPVCRRIQLAAASSSPPRPARRGVLAAADGHWFDYEYAKPVTIGDGVWLASNVVVCGGVTIGDGAVIGAGSVVTRDIPSRVFAAGNPCRVIRPLTAADKMRLPGEPRKE